MSKITDQHYWKFYERLPMDIQEIILEDLVSRIIKVLERKNNALDENIRLAEWLLEDSDDDY